jgi:hypothetical protein
MADTETRLIIKGDPSGAIAAQDKYNAGLKKMQAETSAAFGAIKSGWGAVAGALAIPLSIGGLYSLVRSTTEAAEKMELLQQKTGASYETLKVLSYTAKLSGMDIDGVTKAMGILAKGMQGAAIDIGGAEKSFKALGIGTKDSTGHLKSIDVILPQIADKFQKMNDGTGKTAYAMALFGKSGKDMIPILNQGAGGLKEMKDEMEALGFTFNETGNKQAAALNENLEKLELAAGNMKNRIVKELVPGLYSLSEYFIKNIKDGGELENTITALGNAMKGIASIAIGVAASFDIVGTAIGNAAGRMKGWFSKGNDLALSKDPIKEIASIFNDPSGKNVVAAKAETYGGLIEAIWNNKAPGTTGGLRKSDGGGDAPLLESEKAQKATEKQAEARYKAALELNKLLAEEEEQRNKVHKAVGDSINDLALEASAIRLTSTELKLRELRENGANDAQLELASGILKTIEENKNLKIVLDDQSTSFDQMSKKIMNASALYQAGKITLQEYTKYMDVLAESMEKTKDKGVDSFKELKDAIEGWGRDSADAIVDFCLTGKDSFKGLVDSIIKDMMRMVVQQNITGPMANMVSGWFGGGQQGGSSGGGFNWSQLGSLAGSAWNWVSGSDTGSSWGSLADSVSTIWDWGASFFHSGGVVGSENAPTKYVPSLLFAGAPRLHDGLASDEYPAILQAGETVIPKNKNSNYIETSAMRFSQIISDTGRGYTDMMNEGANNFAGATETAANAIASGGSAAAANISSSGNNFAANVGGALGGFVGSTIGGMFAGALGSLIGGFFGKMAGSFLASYVFGDNNNTNIGDTGASRGGWAAAIAAEDAEGANFGVDPTSGGGVGGGGGNDEGLAKGLSYVPRDNYRARLHEGEAVLTKQEAASWRKGGGVGEIRVYIGDQELTGRMKVVADGVVVERNKRAVLPTSRVYQ